MFARFFTSWSFLFVCLFPNQKATCERLVMLGMKVIGCGRREKRLTEMEKELNSDKYTSNGGMFKGIQCDLFDESQIEKMFSEIEQDKNFKGVDICVNNAGIGKSCGVLELS